MHTAYTHAPALVKWVITLYTLTTGVRLFLCCLGGTCHTAVKWWKCTTRDEMDYVFVHGSLVGHCRSSSATRLHDEEQASHF